MKQRVIRNKEKLIKLFEKNPPDFSEGKFRGVRLAGGVFRNLNFEKADFCYADLRDVNFTESNLASANFESANLSKACLRNADLTGAFLIRADMSQAQLQNANLTRAWLAHSNLSGCQLKNANLTHAIINGANLAEIHDLTQDQLDVCVLIVGMGDGYSNLTKVRGFDFNDRDLPTLPKGMKPPSIEMTYRQWETLEEHPEFLGV